MYYKAISAVNQNDLVDLGRLQVRTVINSVGNPASNVTVRVTNSNNPDVAITELKTDISGSTPLIELPAPPVDYSQQTGQPKPFNTVDLYVSGTDLNPVNVRGVQIFPDSKAVTPVYMSPGSQSNPPTVIDIAPPTLWGDFPRKISEDEVKTGTPVSGLVVLNNAVVPEYVVVHDGVPTDTSAPNYTVPFSDYIKNVACCEIYSTWPRSTITANVLAIISITLNRVYTEWYRSRGFNFTITSSTAFDQAFSYGRNIFTEIAEIVDDVFTTFITKQGIGQPLFTQFCDGANVSCPGWMSQWGSKDLGSKGYNAVDILRHYYGGNIYLMNATKVEGIPMSFSGNVLQLGSTGNDVRTIQTQLNAISKSYPLIQKVIVDGIFGQNTRRSVEIFQSIFNMPETGLVDFATWYRISFIYVAVTGLAEG